MFRVYIIQIQDHVQTSFVVLINYQVFFFLKEGNHRNDLAGADLNQLKNFNHLDKEYTANSQNKEKKIKHFFKNMTPVNVCCWTGNQKQNRKGPSPCPSLMFFYASAPCCGLCWARKVTVLWFPAHLTRTDTLDIQYNKINTLARPSPLHFSSGIRHSLLQVPGKSIVKGTCFQVNSV